MLRPLPCPVDRIEYQAQPDWPPGAWIVRGKPSERLALVQHGVSVETHPVWFGEVIWDGPFADANFDRTDLVYGSGGRLRDGVLTLVASGSTMDRLALTRQGSETLLSNSIACLLAETGGSVDPLYRFHRRDFRTITRGVPAYDRVLKITTGDVELVYHDNVRLGPAGAEVLPKPVPDRDLSSYESYREFLVAALRRLADNLHATQRRAPYEWLGTISTGFDSPTVAALGREAGLREVLTFATARGGASDDGSAIAERLGLDCHTLDRGAWQDDSLPEVPFLASDAKGEDVYFAGARDLLKKRVLLTGYSAGAWAAKGRANQDLRRADQSGLSLSEFRLDADFIHLPLPPMGERSLTDAAASGLAADLEVWRSGRPYDKPFCRRVLRGSGVPDGWYGQENKAASVLVFDRRSLLSKDSLEDYRAHLRRVCRRRPLGAVGKSIRDAAVHVVSFAARLTQAACRAAAPVLPLARVQRLAHSGRLAELAHYEPLSDYLFAWAIERAVQRYRPGSAEPTHELEEPAESVEPRGTIA